MLTAVTGQDYISYRVDLIEPLSVDLIDPLSGVPLGGFGGISSEHWLGVEPTSGRDLFARVVYSLRFSLGVALGAAVVEVIARAEADRAAELLAAAVGGRRVPVFPVISVVGAGALVANHQPRGVTVIAVKKLVTWLLQLPHRYQPHTIDGLYAVARRSTTWQL